MSQDLGEINTNPAKEQEELKQISEKCRKIRIVLKLTQTTLAKSLSQMSRREFTNVTICNFERSQLSVAKMREVRLAIEPWFRRLDVAFNQGKTVNEFMAEIASENGDESPVLVRVLSSRLSQKYKRVTYDQKVVLLAAFAENTHPKLTRYVQLSKQLGLSLKKVQSWFTNQRQAVRRLSLESKNEVEQPECSGMSS